MQGQRLELELKRLADKSAENAVLRAQLDSLRARDVAETRGGGEVGQMVVASAMSQRKKADPREDEDTTTTETESHMSGSESDSDQDSDDDDFQDPNDFFDAEFGDSPEHYHTPTRAGNTGWLRRMSRRDSYGVSAEDDRGSGPTRLFRTASVQPEQRVAGQSMLAQAAAGAAGLSAPPSTPMSPPASTAAYYASRDSPVARAADKAPSGTMVAVPVATSDHHRHGSAAGNQEQRVPSSLHSTVSASSSTAPTVPASSASTALANYVPRTRLPNDRSKEKVSLWKLLKSMVGKDLTSLTLPAYLCEPLSFLQRLCEEFEYYSVIDDAAVTADPYERLARIAAYSVSTYSATIGRTGKPFNPLLGETFQYYDERTGFHFLAEQVSHHPPISAFHCRSRHFTSWGSITPRNKFWGKTIEFHPDGPLHIVLHKTKEHFTWNKPTTTVHNLIIGELYLDHHGEVQVTNTTTGDYAILNLSKRRMFGAGAYRVDGLVFTNKAVSKMRVHGTWSDALYADRVREGTVMASLDAEPTPTATSVLLWKRNELPDWSADQYNMTSFAMGLNELAAPLAPILLPTDTRYRPDSRALENNDAKAAADHKARLEQKQREAKAARVKAKQEWEPRWFRTDPQSGEWVLKTPAQNQLDVTHLPKTSCPDIF